MPEERYMQFVARAYDRRHTEIRVSPSWLATEAMAEIDPDKVLSAVPIAYELAHLQLRQMARGLCRQKFDDGDGSAMSDLFPELQARYPTARSSGEDEPEYVLLDHLSKEDVAFNVARLRKEAQAKLEHAAALEAWGQRRRPPGAPLVRAAEHGVVTGEI